MAWKYLSVYYPNIPVFIEAGCTNLCYNYLYYIIHGISPEEIDFENMLILSLNLSKNITNKTIYEIASEISKGKYSEYISIHETYL